MPSRYDFATSVVELCDWKLKKYKNQTDSLEEAIKRSFDVANDLEGNEFALLLDLKRLERYDDEEERSFQSIIETTKTACGKFANFKLR